MTELFTKLQKEQQQCTGHLLDYGTVLLNTAVAVWYVVYSSICRTISYLHNLPAPQAAPAAAVYDVYIESTTTLL